ncbi:MAG: acetamidase/formamidase family protein, partial [Anaerotignaceae bacterium]
ELTPRVEGASALEPDKYGNVSVFAPIKKVGESYVGYLEENGKEITFPIDPFLGIMGVAANTDDAWSSVPPTSLGGNIDINELGVGATVYLPVEVAGALFYTGDPHFAQGDGEVALTAVEGSLRADLRLTVLKKGSSEIPGNSNEFDMVFAETEDYWIPIGLNEDLDEAMKQSVRESIDFLSEQLGVDRKIAYAYLSAATDYEVSQVVDKTKGIHALISKIDFREYTMFKMLAKDTEIPATVQADGLYVLARSVFNAMGATYSFNDTTKVLTVKYNGNEYSFCESSNKYYVNGEVKTLTKSPYISNGSYYIPTTALLDVMEIPLNWSTDGVNIYGNLGY